jgi:hypothetical protein
MLVVLVVMRIEVNLDRKFLVFSVVIGLIIVGFVGVYAYNANGVGGNPAIMGHSVDEMNWTKRIPMINATMVCINENCITSWPSVASCTDGEVLKWASATGTWTCAADNGGGTSQWTTSGSNIYYDNGRVGIGTATPLNKLHVVGTINATADILAGGDVRAGDQVCIRGVCKGAWPSAAKPTAKWYSWEKSTSDSSAEFDMGDTSSHDVCFLTRVYSHDDSHNNRLEGCRLAPVAGSGNLDSPQRWKMLIRAHGGYTYCSAICLSWD